MVFSSAGLWTFETNELISLIAAIATFLAVVVSLFLALKSKTINYKVAVNHSMMGLRITNTGDAKFLINAFGVCVNNKYYMNSYERFCKVMPISREVGQRFSTFQEHSLGYVLLEPGDVVEVGFCVSVGKSIFQGKVFLFACIAGKIKKFQLDVTKISVVVNHDMNKYKEYTKQEIENIGFYLRNH